MARFSGGTRSTGAGSTTLPVGSLYAIATVAPKLREVGLTNTTSTAVALKLSRFDTVGTQGSGLTESKYDGDSVVNATLFDTHTGAPAVPPNADLGYRATLGAAVGSGVIWTFGDTGIRIGTGTQNGIGIIVATGTGQILDWYMTWDE